jgi:LacI family transcriptional regulator
MRDVVDHLVERGYRKVAYVPIGWGAGPMLRRDALVAALRARRRPAPTILDPGDAGLAGLHDVAIALQRGSFDVVVCCDDKTALTLMDELRQIGMAIPDDIGVVGFDDIPFARIANPRLTTVSQGSNNLGRQCADFLLTTVETGSLPRSQLMPVSLIVRETTPGPSRSTPGQRSNKERSAR